jgi:hypothetical protein
MRVSLLALSAAIALAGCNNGPSTAESAAKTGDIRLENATAEEVVKQVAAAQDKNKIQPGEWENSVQIVAAEMPGVPEAMRKQVEAETKKAPQVTKECKKAEDAKAMDFSRLAPAAQGCTFPKYVAAGGKIDANMECKGPAGLIQMTITGTQSPTAYDITMTQSQAMPGATGQSKMTLKASGKRIGECKA